MTKPHFTPDGKLTGEGRKAAELAREPHHTPAPTMHQLIASIARMTQDGEEVDGEEFIMENDDAVSTLNELIAQAREILK